MINRLILCLCLALSVNASASNTLDNFDVSYTAKVWGFNVAGVSRLTANGNTYHYEFNADSFVGDVRESSDFIWNAEKQVLYPIRYIYKRNGLGKDKDDELIFDWSNKRVTNIQSNHTQTLNDDVVFQDSVSYQVQLRQDLIAGKKQFEYSITNGRRLKQYKFEVIGEEPLKTALGTVNTVKVKRTRNKDDIVTYAWFAKDFHYLLVSMTQEENGSAYTISVSKAAFNGKAIEHF